jgi:hypothetical protein
MANKVSFSGEHGSLEDIEEYYVDSESALNCYFEPSGAGRIIPAARFIGYTKEEISNELKSRKESLDRMCSLEILAAIEAKFRIDYLVRSQKKKKDDLSKAFREIYRTKKNKASLTDDIIQTWKSKYPQHKTRWDNLGKALDYRNWLAHGRYWMPKKSPHISKYDYLTIYMLASDILGNMDLHEN